jgi:orotate phosphoribosyltransferase-like protein
MIKHGGARKGAGRPQTQIDIRRILSLKDQGFSMNQIAQRFSVSLHIIRYAINKAKKGN